MRSLFDDPIPTLPAAVSPSTFIALPTPSCGNQAFCRLNSGSWEVLRTTIEDDDAPLDVAARLQQKQRKATSHALDVRCARG